MSPETRKRSTEQSSEHKLAWEGPGHTALDSGHHVHAEAYKPVTQGLQLPDL